MTRRGKNHHYLTDALDSVVALVAETDTKVTTYAYSPLSVQHAGTTEQAPQPYRFAGGYQDPTGLYHFAARYYDPNIGRFTTRSRVSVTSDVVGERELARGQQLDVREIAAFGTNAELTDQAVAAQMAKYATKSADASGTLDHALSCRPCQERGATLPPHGTPLPCTTCDGTGHARPLPRLAVARHVRQMIRTCWELGKLP